MDDELRFFLKRGPTSVKELARLTGKSDSGIRKAIINAGDEVSTTKNEKGVTLAFIPPKTNEDGAGATKAGESTPAPSATENGAPASPAAAKDGRGRKATAAGQNLFPSEQLLVGDDSPQTYQNPRRQNSHGYRSLQIVIDNPGITTEEYVAKGGRLNDLRWDIAHGNVRAE